MFDDTPAAGTLFFHWDWPRATWIRDSAYGGIANDLAGGVTVKTKPLFDLYFGELHKSAKYLCLESRGELVLSETSPVFEEVMVPAITTYFLDFFKRKRVIALSRSTHYFETTFQSWAETFKIPLFYTEEECRAFLRNGLNV